MQVFPGMKAKEEPILENLDPNMIIRENTTRIIEETVKKVEHIPIKHQVQHFKPVALSKN